MLFRIFCGIAILLFFVELLLELLAQSEEFAAMIFQFSAIELVFGGWIIELLSWFCGVVVGCGF